MTTGPNSARSDAAAALAAAASGAPVVARLERTGAFSARGPDAGSFLHGQLAADIASLVPGRSVHSLLLNHKGHALAEAVVARDDSEWLIVAEDSMADWVGETLAQHIIFDDVTLARVAAVATLTVQGAGAVAALHGAVPGAGLDTALATGAGEAAKPSWRGIHADSGLDLVIYPRARSLAGGYDLTLLGAGRTRVGEGAADQGEAGQRLAGEVRAAALQLERSLVAAGAVRVTAGAVDAARIAAGIATAGRDAGAGVLPQEAGLTGALSYRKGCYLGQEVMARIEARGNLKRGLVTVELTPATHAGDGAATGTGEGAAADAGGGTRAIVLAGKTVGVLGTTATMPDGRWLALAVLRRDLTPDARLSVGASALRIVGPAPLWNAS